MRIGIVGGGRAVTALHLPALARLEGVRVTALAELDPQRRASVAAEWQIPRTHADAEALASDGEVDLVLIATPTATHEDVFMAAAEAGKPVYLEKPMALDLDQAGRMLRAWERHRAPVALGFNLRSHRLVQRARAMVRARALGRVQFVRSLVVGGLSGRPAWQLDPARGGGPAYELGVHHFDLWRYMLDEDPCRVESVAGPMQDAVTVAARFPGGALASGTFVMNGTAAHEVEIGGDRGTIRFSLYRGDSFQVRPAGRVGELAAWVKELPEAARAARRRGDYQDSYRVHWLRFLEGLRAGTAPPATLEDGREALRVTLEAIA